MTLPDRLEAHARGRIRMSLTEIAAAKTVLQLYPSGPATRKPQPADRIPDGATEAEAAQTYLRMIRGQ
jgi:hypothetical protein